MTLQRKWGVNLDYVLGPPVWEPDGRHADVPVAPPAGGTNVVAPASVPTTMHVWKGGDGSGSIEAAEPASNGHDVLVVNAKGAIFIQDGRTGAVRSSWPGPSDLAFGSTSVSGAAIHTAPELIATIVEGRVTVRALPSGKVVSRVPGNDATSVAYAGSALLVQRTDGVLEVWDDRGTQQRSTMPGDPSFLYPPVANRQGTLVARRRSNGSIVLVDLASGTTLAVVPSLDPLGTRRVGVAFGPSGTDIVTITDPQRYLQPAPLVQRDLSTRALVRSACTTAGRDLTPKEWHAFVGTTPPTDLSCR